MPATRPAVEPSTASRILGTVVTRGGSPVDGAVVRVCDGPLFGPRAVADPHVVATAVTGPGGRYEIDAPRAELLGVLVTAEGLAPASRNQLPGVDLPIELRKAARLRLKVTRGEAETPVEGVDLRVRAAGLVEGAVVRERGGSTTADGSLELTGLPREKELDVEVRAPGVPLRVEEVVMGGGAESVWRVRLPDVRARGLVVDEVSRAPLAGVRVRDETGRWLAETDAQGRFEIGATGANLVLEAPGYCASVTGLSPDPDGPSELSLSPAARLRARVTTSKGEPLREAQVSWVAGHWRRLGPAGDHVRAGEASLEARTDPEGRFEWGEIPWGVETLVLAVTFEGERREFRGTPARAPGELVEFEWTWHTGRFVSGYVQCLGSPTRARVFSSREGSTDVRSVWTDGTGAFAFEDLAPGRHELRARLPDGSESPSFYFDTASPEDGRSVSLRIATSRARFEGAVYHEGRPVGGHQVWASRLGANGFVDPVVDLGGARCDGDGRFDFSFGSPPDARAVLTTRWGASSIEVHPWALGPGSSWRAIELALPAMKSRVLSLDPRRAAVSAVRVRWRYPDGSLGGQCRMGAQVAVSEAGRLEVELPARPLDLEVEVRDGLGSSTWFERVDGSGDSPIPISF